MGQVSDFIREHIRKCVEIHGLVVWYDPQRAYPSLLEQAWDGLQIIPYRGSWLQLRREVDDVLEAGSTPQRLGESFPGVLVYVPGFSRAQSEYALVEVEAAGLVLEPGLPRDPRSNLERDTDLASMAVRALGCRYPESELRRIEADVREGKLGLQELDALVRPPQLPPGLTLFYGQQLDSKGLALAFITEPAKDADLKERRLLPDLVQFWVDHFELPARAYPEPDVLRSAAIALLLLTEAAVSSGEPDHKAWQGLPIPASPQARALAVQVVQAWRGDRNLKEHYAEQANRIARDISDLPRRLAQLSDAALASLETFQVVEEILLDRAAQAITQKGDAKTRETWRAWCTWRQEKGFWADYNPDWKRVWRAVVEAIQVLDRAAEIHRALSKGRARTVALLVQEYSDPEQGWYQLDRAYRHFEHFRDALQEMEPRPSLTKLIHYVRGSYREAVQRMADRLASACEAGGLPHSGADSPALQRTLFDEKVVPMLKAGERIGVILVDALRYELAVELEETIRQLGSGASLGNRHMDAVLQPALGTLPGITVLGMAACLPGASTALGLVEVNGNLAAEVNGRMLRNRDDRVQYLREQLKGLVTSPIEECSLEALNDMHDRELAKLQQAGFILVTSQEIDQVAENMSPGEAMEHFGRVLRLLWRALYRLSEIKMNRIFLVADHGFLLFGGGLEDADKIDSPPGKTVKIGRRYWIGREGKPGPTYVYFQATDLDLTGDLEYAFPRGAGAFKAAGGHDRYFHGGLSLQEMVIPFMEIRLEKAQPATPLRWELKVNTERVTTSVLVVSIQAHPDQLFLPGPQRVRLQVLVNDRPVQARVEDSGCNYQETLDMFILEPAEDEPVYPPCQVVLFLPSSELPSQGVLSLVLLNPDTGAPLIDPVRVPIDIAIR